MTRPKRTLEERAADIKAQLKAAKRKESELKKPTSSKKVTVSLKSSSIKPVKGISAIAAAKVKVLATKVSHAKGATVNNQKEKGGQLVIVAKRHAKENAKKTPLQRITWPVISKVGKKAGIKRLSHFGDVIREKWLNYMRSTVGDSVIICDYMRRKTLSIDHVKLASERHGERLYCENGL